MSDEIERLRGRLHGDAGGPDYPLLVDALRRAGRFGEAAEVARAGLRCAPDLPAGRVALALVHLDSGRLDAAREELSRVLGGPSATPELGPPHSLVDFDAGVGSDEIESAFERAEIDPAPMIDAHCVAERVVEHVIRGEGAEGDLARVPPVESATFRTETMAELLERQGDLDGARAIRLSLREADPGGLDARSTPSRRDRTLATLESWLRNVGRGTA